MPAHGSGARSSTSCARLTGCRGASAAKRARSSRQRPRYRPACIGCRPTPNWPRRCRSTRRNWTPRCCVSRTRAWSPWISRGTRAEPMASRRPCSRRCPIRTRWTPPRTPTAPICESASPTPSCTCPNGSGWYSGCATTRRCGCGDRRDPRGHRIPRLPASRQGRAPGTGAAAGRARALPGLTGTLA